jgi:large subunit ribosomal protein L23
MRGPQAIIKAPVISEKGSLLAETMQQVLFKVRPDANKIEVKMSVEALFKVKVVKVRMARYLGKVRRVGKSTGRRPEWKKAYVTLRQGDKIDLFGAA